MGLDFLGVGGLGWGEVEVLRLRYATLRMTDGAGDGMGGEISTSTGVPLCLVLSSR